jgi:hypothetical protein
MAEAEPVIEFACRVPIEHVKIDPAPAAFDRDRGEPRHEPPSDAMSTRCFGYIEVFDVQPWPAG